MTEEDMNRVHFIGLHPRRWEELKKLIPEKISEGERLPRLFGLLDGIAVLQDGFFPEDKVGLFDRDKVLIGWLRLGGDHEAGKKEGAAEPRGIGSGGAFQDG
jgi:hypothetical protein